MNFKNIPLLRLLTFYCLFLTFFFSACGSESNSFEDDFSTVPAPFSIEGIQPVETTSGLVYYDIDLGTGNFEVTIRDRVSIFYTKRRNDTGEVFESSYVNGRVSPIASDVSSSPIIIEEGFIEGILGMKEGGKRVLILPPSLAYGDNENSSLQDVPIRIDFEISTIFF